MEKGFFASLFDFSFRSFITIKIVRVFYILAMIFIGLYALGLLIFVASAGGSTGLGGLGVLLGLVGAGLIFLLGVMYIRVLLETILVLFRIEGNTARIAGTNPPAPGVGADSPSGPNYP